MLQTRSIPLPFGLLGATRRSTPLRTLLFAILAAFSLPGSGAAQTEAEVNAGIQFNFTTPGARSLALGGAFVGRADDATAAFTNPAGLVNLTEPQVSTEMRRFTFNNTFTDRGHAFGFATGVGVDTVEGLRLGEAEDDVTSLSFLSFVYPRGVSPVWGKSDKPTARWALAAYRHELLSFETRFQASGAFFDFLNAPGERSTTRLRPSSRSSPASHFSSSTSTIPCAMWREVLTSCGWSLSLASLSSGPTKWYRGRSEAGSPPSRQPPAATTRRARSGWVGYA